MTHLSPPSPYPKPVLQLNSTKLPMLISRFPLLPSWKKKKGTTLSLKPTETLCPGRFFATTEITAAVAMVVMRFEIEPINSLGKRGQWVFPKVDGNRVASSIHPPSEDVRVRVREREGFRGDEWGFGFAGGV